MTPEFIISTNAAFILKITLILQIACDLLEVLKNAVKNVHVLH